MSRRPLPTANGLPRRGLFVGGSAGGRMGSRPLGTASPAAALDRCAEATTSFLIWDENVRLLVDAGTGLGACVEILRRLDLRDPYAESVLVLTHYHEDHWCGLRWCGPFAGDDLPSKTFSPAFDQGFSREAADAGEPPLRRLIERLDEPGFWPTPVLDGTAALDYAAFVPGETLSAGRWTIRTCSLPHPGGCVGYRAEMPGGLVVAVATDCEFDDSPSESERETRKTLLDGVDLLLLDVQYLDDEYDGHATLGGVAKSRRFWGHNSPRLAAAALAGLDLPPRTVLLTHHDPNRTISDLHDERIGRELRQRWSDAHVEVPTIANLMDGDLWDLESPSAPRSVRYGGAAHERGGDA